MPLPNLIVAGTMRSGSSSLNHYLSLHPQIFMSPDKELHYFSSRFDQGIDWYSSNFDGADGQPVIGECTPSYIYREDALQRIAETLPDARLIVIVRNPVERAHSHYWMKRVRLAELRPFAEAAEAEIPHIRNLDYRTSVGTGYLTASNYADLLERLYRYVDAERVRVVCLEHVMSDPVGEMNSIAGFLGIDPYENDRRLRRVVNRNLEIRSLWLRRLSWRLPGKLTSLVAKINSKPLDYRGNLGPETRQMLEEVFAPLNRRLEEMTGLDLSCWGEGATIRSEPSVIRQGV